MKLTLELDHETFSISSDRIFADELSQLAYLFYRAVTVANGAYCREPLLLAKVVYLCRENLADQPEYWEGYEEAVLRFIRAAGDIDRGWREFDKKVHPKPE